MRRGLQVALCAFYLLLLSPRFLTPFFFSSSWGFSGVLVCQDESQGSLCTIFFFPVHFATTDLGPT